LLSLFTITVISSPTACNGNRHVLHERRNRPPPQWLKRQKLAHDEVIPVKIAINQRNLDRAEDYIYDVSHPRSLKYGQHWTPRMVAETFAPRYESYEAHHTQQTMGKLGVDLSTGKKM
jgi:tripeptidyl-peptidase-1